MVKLNFLLVERLKIIGKFKNEHCRIRYLGRANGLRLHPKEGFWNYWTKLPIQKNEIDIIAKKDNQLIIIEVKTRQTAEIGEPWKAVTRNKQKQIIQVANRYVQLNNIKLETRFDIISIIHNTFRTELTHLEGAFYPHW